MNKYSIIKLVCIYYLQVAVFAIASFGLIFLLYGRAGISILQWLVIVFITFTIGYIPVIIRLLRCRGEGG